MSLSLAKKLREKRANLHSQQGAILKKAEDENRAMNAEERTQFDAMDTEFNDLGAQVRSIEAHEESQRDLNTSRGRKAGGADEGDADEKRDAEEEAEARNTAFTGYLRYGVEGLNDEHRATMRRMRSQEPVEQRDQSVGTNSAGGFTVAPEFYRVLTEAQKAFGGMADVATSITTETGANLPMPTVNETAQTGEIIGENTVVTQQDIAFGQVVIGAFKFSSKLVLVPFELLQDTAFDISSYIAKALGIRLARIKNTKFTVGAGTTEPNGIVPKSTLGFQGIAGETTSLIYSDLIELIHSVDPSYRQTARFMMNDTTLKTIKQFKDTQNRPLFLPGLAVKEPDTINGYPFTINQDVAVEAASAKSILFGDLSKYFIRNVRDLFVLRLVERYADKGQVGFIGFERADGNLLDAGTHPVKYFQNSAT